MQRFLQRTEAAEVSWPLPPELDEAAREKKLFPSPPPPSAGPRPQPDYAAIHKELRKPNVTLKLLWEEYKQEHPTGYGQSFQFFVFRQDRFIVDELTCEPFQVRFAE